MCKTLLASQPTGPCALRGPFRRSRPRYSGPACRNVCAVSFDSFVLPEYWPFWGGSKSDGQSRVPPLSAVPFASGSNRRSFFLFIWYFGIERQGRGTTEKSNTKTHTQIYRELSIHRSKTCLKAHIIIIYGVCHFLARSCHSILVQTCSKYYWFIGQTNIRDIPSWNSTEAH